MEFYRISAGNLLNSRSNSFQWIGAWWKDGYFLRKHGGLYFLSDGCGDTALHAHSLRPACISHSLQQIPTSSQPSRMGWVGFGEPAKKQQAGNPVFVNRDPVQSSPRGAEGQPCLMCSTRHLFVSCLVTDTIVYEAHEDGSSHDPAGPTLGAVPHLYIHSFWNHAMVQNLGFLLSQKTETTEIRITFQCHTWIWKNSWSLWKLCFQFLSPYSSYYLPVIFWYWLFALVKLNLYFQDIYPYPSTWSEWWASAFFFPFVGVFVFVPSTSFG